MTGEYKPYRTFKGLDSSQALIVEYQAKDNSPEWLHLYYHQLKSRRVNTIEQNSIMLDLETPEILASVILRNFAPNEYSKFINHLLKAQIETLHHYPHNPEEAEQPTITIASVKTLKDKF